MSDRAHCKWTNISYFRNNARVWSRLNDTRVNCFIPVENYLVSKGKASSVELWESDTFCQVPRSPPRSFRSQWCRRHGGIPAASAWAILIRYISDTKGKGGMLIAISLSHAQERNLSFRNSNSSGKGNKYFDSGFWFGFI